ncbi:MAG: hypothetical protein EBR02_02945 [Alphaproteobacteria bacterium]|nr:hypothetical protein [Alphaproteobacteria bacterium]
MSDEALSDFSKMSYQEINKLLAREKIGEQVKINQQALANLGFPPVKDDKIKLEAQVNAMTQWLNKGLDDAVTELSKTSPIEEVLATARKIAGDEYKKFRDNRKNEFEQKVADCEKDKIDKMSTETLIAQLVDNHRTLFTKVIGEADKILHKDRDKNDIEAAVEERCKKVEIRLRQTQALEGDTKFRESLQNEFQEWKKASTPEAIKEEAERITKKKKDNLTVDIGDMNGVLWPKEVGSLIQFPTFDGAKGRKV